MSDIEGMLNRWEAAGVLDAGAAERIRVFELEQKQPMGLRWQGIVALALGALLLACGVGLFVSAHWDQVSPAVRFALVMGMVTVFHLGGAFSRAGFRGLSTALHAVGTISAGAGIALVGQIFNIEDHWPAAILLWAVAALAGWILLRDEAQQVLTLLLFPAWGFCELEFYADGQIGATAYLGRFLVVWAVLYLTYFLNSRRRVLWALLFAAGAIAAVAGTAMMLAGWRSWRADQTFLSLELWVWAWVAIAGLPLLISLLNRKRSLLPVLTAIGLVLALPWCQHMIEQRSQAPFGPTVYRVYEPSWLAYLLVAGLAVFLIWWGVRQVSRALVNFGIVGFALNVGAFYFSHIFDKIGRSLGLIGLGILFLAGGWALEKTRRSLMERLKPATLEAR